MAGQIKTYSLGKLRIYLKAGENIKSESLLRRLFPNNLPKNIIELAKKEGLMNASVYNTQMGYSNFERIQNYHIESDNAGLTVCVELIDSKENLQKFFQKHKAMFKDKVIIFKEVEYWEAE
jgi:PII-like signaling protein